MIVQNKGFVVQSNCDYPKQELCKIMANILNNLPVFQYCAESSSVDLGNELMAVDEFTERLYYVTAMSLINRTAPNLALFHNNTNPMIQPANNTQYVMDDTCAQASYTDRTALLFFVQGKTEYSGVVPLGQYSLITVAGHGHLQLEKSQVVLVHTLPTLASLNAYAAWLRMEEH